MRGWSPWGQKGTGRRCAEVPQGPRRAVGQKGVSGPSRKWVTEQPLGRRPSVLIKSVLLPLIHHEIRPPSFRQAAEDLLVMLLEDHADHDRFPLGAWGRTRGRPRWIPGRAWNGGDAALGVVCKESV